MKGDSSRESVQANLMASEDITFNLTTTREMTDVVFSGDNEAMIYSEHFNYEGLPDEVD
jgi:hypothetical protein